MASDTRSYSADIYAIIRAPCPANLLPLLRRAAPSPSPLLARHCVQLKSQALCVIARIRPPHAILCLNAVADNQLLHYIVLCPEDIYFSAVLKKLSVQNQIFLACERLGDIDFLNLLCISAGCVIYGV